MPPLPPTEQRNPLSHNLDALSPLDLARLINRLDADVPLAVAECLPQIAQIIERVGDVLANDGRLFYLGAGTSGRLAVLDAVELVPTFGIDPAQVVGLIAGGAAAMMRSVEGAEDDAEQGAARFGSAQLFRTRCADRRGGERAHALRCGRAGLGARDWCVHRRRGVHTPAPPSARLPKSPSRLSSGRRC